MTLNEGDLVLRLWAAVIPPDISHGPGDWQCLAVLRAAGGLEAEYRFRWHAGTGRDEDDRKNFYRIGPIKDTPEAREDLFRAIRAITTKMPGFADVQEREINSTNHHKLIEALDSIHGMTFSITEGHDPEGHGTK